MKKFDQINVIPFIDIMLVLLAIILMTATFIAQGKIDVNLPTSKAPTKLHSEDKEGIYYLKDGEIVDEKIGVNELEKIIENWPENQRVTLKIDAKTAFQHFIAVQEMLKDKKFRVAVLAVPEEK